MLKCDSAVVDHYQRNGSGKWYAKWKDARGEWQSRPTTARTKTEAKRLAHELEVQAERQRLGLEPLPINATGTLAELATWWLNTHSVNTVSHHRNVSWVTKHLIESPVGVIALREFKPAVLEDYLGSIASNYSAQTLNHIRRFVTRIFNTATKHGRYTGENPGLAVSSRKVPKRLPNYLRTHEVRPVIEAINAEWRSFYATAVCPSALDCARASCVDCANRTSIGKIDSSWLGARTTTTRRKA